MNRFDRDTQVEPIGPHRYRTRFDPGWWIVAGPNGGYMASVILRAIEAEVGEPARAPRSLTVHYASRPSDGPVEIETRVERVGRSLSTVSARVMEGDRLIAVALAALSRPRGGPRFQHVALPPEVRPPERSTPMTRPAERAPIPMHERFETRFATDVRPWSGAEQARTVAWIRLAEDPRPVDALLAATLADALPPAVFAVARPDETLGAVPTIDLTVHFRAPLPHPGLSPGDFVLAAFQTRVLADGFLEEDGELYAPDGTLLAQSRQLAVLV